MRTKKVLFYALIFILGGCIPVISLNSFYNKSDVMFDDNLLGTWIDDPCVPKNTWIFSKNEDPNNTYKLEFIDEEGRKGLFVASLIGMKGSYFLDVYPAQMPWEPNDPNKTELFYNTFFMIPAHTIVKVNSIVPQLVLGLTEEDKIKDLFKENPGAVEYKEIEERIVLTASTKDLQAFILKYSADDRLFPDKITLNRLKAESAIP